MWNLSRSSIRMCVWWYRCPPPSPPLNPTPIFAKRIKVSLKICCFVSCMGWSVYDVEQLHKRLLCGQSLDLHYCTVTYTQLQWPLKQQLSPPLCNFRQLVITQRKIVIIFDLSFKTDNSLGLSTSSSLSEHLYLWTGPWEASWQKHGMPHRILLSQ